MPSYEEDISGVLSTISHSENSVRNSYPSALGQTNAKNSQKSITSNPSGTKSYDGMCLTTLIRTCLSQKDTPHHKECSSRVSRTTQRRTTCETNCVDAQTFIVIASKRDEIIANHHQNNDEWNSIVNCSYYATWNSKQNSVSVISG